MQITSPQNEKIKHARKVRDSRDPGLIFIEGLRLAEEAVRSGLVIETVFVAEDFAKDPRAAKLLTELEAKHSSALFTASAEVMKSLADTVQSQGIALLARRPRPSTDDLAATTSDKGHAPLWLALDRLQDPGNVGTLIRTGEAAGVDGIVTTKGSADTFSPKALRSAMGSAFRLPIVESVTEESLLDLKSRLGLKIVAAAGEGENDYTDYDWKQPTLLLLGNEGRGVSDSLMQSCDQRLRIPMHAGVESLNVSAAGAVMLFEAARQRRLAAASS